MPALHLIPGLLSNIAIVVIEIYVLSRITDRKNIFKFYTFLSNFIALITSAVFVAAWCVALLKGCMLPVWVKGLRFTATYGLACTLLVFAFILQPLYRKSGSGDTESLFHGISHNRANLLLHYLCPVLSLVSYYLFERTPALQDGQWTLYAALPSILYWVLYLVLTLTHLWEEPYGLSSKNDEPGSKGSSIFLMLIPVLCYGLEHLLWWLNTL